MKFRCSFCPESFPSLLRVRNHTQTEHHEQNYQRKLERFCRLVKHKSFKVNKASKRSMISEKTDGDKRRSSVVIEHDSASNKARVSCSSLRFKCNLCPERFPSLLTVRNHTRNEHQDQNENDSQKKKRLNIPKPGNWLNQGINDIKATPIYRCLACTFASISYDLMIEHCQHHIIDEAPEDVIIKPFTRIETEVIGEKVDVDSHTYEEYHDDSNMDSFMFVDCDYELLKSDKMPGIFETFNKHEIDKINCSSIYYFTRIIHFTSEGIKSSAPFMLYKCMKCMKYVDPYSVAAHVQENSCSKQHKGFSCYDCELPFLTENSMYIHYKTHKVTNADMKHMTISFNYNADKQINAILLKSAGRNMCVSGNNNNVQQTPGTLQPQGGVNNTLQKGPGVAQPQVGVNSTVQQGPGIAQPQVGVNSTVQQGPGIAQPQGGVNSTVQQGPGIAQPQGGVQSTVQLGPSIGQPQGGVNSTVQQGPGIGQPQGGVNITVQLVPGIAQPHGGVHSTVQQRPGIVQPLGGVNSTVKQGPGIAQPQGGVNSTVQQRPGNDKQAGVNKPAEQASAIEQSQVRVINSQTSKDARTMIIQGKNKTNESPEMADNIAIDKVAPVYKCHCDICFHTLEHLFKHIENCTADLIIKKITCLCSLVFDEQQYELHYNLHSRGVTKFNVKKVIVSDEKVIVSKQYEYNEKAVTKEDNTKKVTKKDIVDAKAKTSKRLNEDVEKTTIDEIRKNAISQLTTSILNLPSMLTRVSDKFVEKQHQTTVISTRAVDSKSDDVTDKPVDKFGGPASMAVTHVHEANAERNTKEDEGGQSHFNVRTNNIVISDKAVDTCQELVTNDNKIMNCESGSTEENLSMVATTIEVELMEENNTNITKHGEHTKTLKCNNQETEAINGQSNRNECEEIIEEYSNEDVQSDNECSISLKINVNEPEVKNVVAENKIYTEDELLNEDELSNEDKSMYFDANSLLAYDEDSILL